MPRSPLPHRGLARCSSFRCSDRKGTHGSIISDKKQAIAVAFRRGMDLCDLLGEIVIETLDLFETELVAGFSRSSNLSVIRAGTGSVIGDGGLVRVQISGLIE